MPKKLSSLGRYSVHLLEFAEGGFVILRLASFEGECVEKIVVKDQFAVRVSFCGGYGKPWGSP